MTKAPTKTAQVYFPGSMEFLGWHGSFIVGTLVLFKVLLPAYGGASGCPCTGHVAYGTAMMVLPAISIFVVTFFAYFYQDDKKLPWKDLKAYFKFKQPCASYAPTSRDWDMHSGVFHQCNECQGKWRTIKITVSFCLSLLYSILWLALEFHELTYYACASVGPDPNGILQYCDNWKNTDDKYRKKYILAVFKSLLVGNVLLVVVIVLASAIIVLYCLIRSKVADVTDSELEGNNDLPSLSNTNNFGYDNEARLGSQQIPGAQPRMDPKSHSTEGSYEGFRDRPGGVIPQDRRSPARDTQHLIKVDAI